MMVQRRLQGGEKGVKMYKSTIHCAYHTVSENCAYCTVFLGDQELGGPAKQLEIFEYFLDGTLEKL